MVQKTFFMAQALFFALNLIFSFRLFFTQTRVSEPKQVLWFKTGFMVFSLIYGAKQFLTQ